MTDARKVAFRAEASLAANTLVPRRLPDGRREGGGVDATNPTGSGGSVLSTSLWGRCFNILKVDTVFLKRSQDIIQQQRKSVDILVAI